MSGSQKIEKMADQSNAPVVKPDTGIKSQIPDLRRLPWFCEKGLVTWEEFKGMYPEPTIPKSAESTDVGSVREKARKMRREG